MITEFLISYCCYLSIAVQRKVSQLGKVLDVEIFSKCLRYKTPFCFKTKQNDKKCPKTLYDICIYVPTYVGPYFS